MDGAESGSHPDEDASGSAGSEGFDNAEFAGMKVSDDGMWAAIILGVALAVLILGGGFYYSRGKKSSGGLEAGGDFQWGEDETEAFEPPAARQEYINFKRTASVEKAEDLKQLKKSLMQRCFKAIPLLHELQNGAPSADRLYKKGMITDATYERFKHMKEFFDVEFPEVQAEASKLYPGWEKTIWQEANNFYHLRNKQRAEAQGADAKMAHAQHSGGDDDDEDDSLMITSPVKGKKDESDSPLSAEKEQAKPKSKKSKALENMTPEQKAERARAELEKEEDSKDAKGKKKSK